MATGDPGSVALLVEKDPIVREIYGRLRAVLAEIGTVREDPKKTSIHLVHTVGFAGVHPRKAAIILNLRTAAPLASPRIVKQEQVSRNRWHNEIRITSPDEVDAELADWLRTAYALG